MWASWITGGAGEGNRRVGPGAAAPAVADLLHANLNDQVAPEHYGHACRCLVAGRVEQFCNMGAWCVLPAYRSHSIRRLIAMLAQEGYHFTCLSPSDRVRAITSQLEFRWLDTSAALIPNLPWPERSQWTATY